MRHVQGFHPELFHPTMPPSNPTPASSLIFLAGLSHFSAPRSISDAGVRLESNLAYFLSNYALVCVATAVYGVLFKPWFFFFLVVISAIGYQLIVKVRR